MEIEKNQKLN